MKQCLSYLTFEYCSVFIMTPLKTGLGLTFSSSKEIHWDTCCVIAFAFLVWFPNVKCAFSRRRPKNRWDCTRQTQLVADFEWIFISKSNLDYTLLDCYWEVCFFLLLKKIAKKKEKKRKNIIYTDYYHWGYKYRR